MTFLPFRTRSPSRDLETDRARSAELTALLERLSVDIQREMDGLQVRYGRAADIAAFCADVEESGERADLAPRIGRQSVDLKRCANRIAHLREQLECLHGLAIGAGSFAKGRDRAA